MHIYIHIYIHMYIYIYIYIYIGNIQSGTPLRAAGDRGLMSGVLKGRFSKGGFSNLCVIMIIIMIIIIIAKPPFTKPPFVNSRSCTAPLLAGRCGPRRKQRRGFSNDSNNDNTDN